MVTDTIITLMRQKKKQEKTAAPDIVRQFADVLLICDTSYGKNLVVRSVCSADNSACRVRCVYDLAVSHVDAYMTGVADNVARLCIGVRYFSTFIAELTGGSCNVVTKCTIDLIDKSGAVCAICQAVAAIDVRIADVLHCIVNNRLAVG